MGEQKNTLMTFLTFGWSKPKSDNNARKPLRLSERKAERGNVFFTLFGAVAIVGILGAGIMSTMRGPLTSMVEVNRRSQAEVEMTIASRLALLEATQDPVTNGDCDGDGFVEPLAFNAAAPNPVGGGQIPSAVGSDKIDPWGTEYGYCVWDAGGLIDNGGCNGDNRLAGNGNGADETYPIIALISAGPDRVFQTTCTGGATPVVTKAAGSDDLINDYTYAEATAATGGLWNIQSGTPSTAEIDKDIEVKGTAKFRDGIDLSAAGFSSQLRLGAASMILPTQADLAATDCDGDDPANALLLRINTGTTPDSLEICDGGNSWVSVAAGSSLWQTDGPGGPGEIYYSADNVGIGMNNPAEALDVTGNIKLTNAPGTGSILFDGPGIINADGLNITTDDGIDIDLTDTINVTGASQVNFTSTAVNISGTNSTNTAKALRVLNSTPTEIFTVRNDGRVGVMTAAPSEALDVTGNINTSGVYKIDGATIFDNNDSATTSLIGQGATYGGAVTDYLSIMDVIHSDIGNNRVGIGFGATYDVANFNDTLEVNGSADVAGSFNATSAATFGDTVDVTGATTLSSTLQVDGNVSAGDGEVNFTGDIDVTSEIFVNNDRLGPPDVCTATQKLKWTNSSGWSCIDGSGAGGTGGVYTIQEILAAGDDANNEDIKDLFRVGSDFFCNANFSTCTDITSIQASSIFEQSGIVVRAQSSVTYSTADFVFGSPQLTDSGVTGEDSRFYFDKSLSAFRAGSVTNTDWDTPGQYSAAFGSGTVASGIASMAWGTSAAGFGDGRVQATQTAATAWGAGTVASGQYSTAWGGGRSTNFSTNPVASGEASTAWGGSSIASGQYSTAWGGFTSGVPAEASGSNSTAFGNDTEASGQHSVAFGAEVVAGSGAPNTAIGGGHGNNTLAIGLQSQNQANKPQITGDRSFGVFMDGNVANANSTFDLTGSDLFAIIGGRALIDPTSTEVDVSTGVQQLELDVTGDIGAINYCDQDGNNCIAATALGGGGGGLFEVNGIIVRGISGLVTYSTDDFVFGSPQLTDSGVVSEDARMFFDKSTAAFRAGGVTGTQWDSVGDFSAAFGSETSATANYAMAWGQSTNATGLHSTAWGESTTASGQYSTAIGLSNVASGDYSIATGRANIVSGLNSTAMGREASAGSGTAGDGTGSSSIAIGLQSSSLFRITPPKVTGNRSMVLFFDGNASGVNDNYDFTDNDKFALIGGEFQIDDISASANKGCIRYNSGSTQLEFSHDCTTNYTAFGDVDASTPGNDTEVIFNESGTFGTDSTFTFNSATNNLGIGGDLTVSGNDIVMGTNTAGHLLIGDNSDFTPTAMSGDATIDGLGALTVAANAIEEAMLDVLDAPADGECLTYDSGGRLEWDDCSGALMAGNDTEVIFSDSGMLAGDAGFTYSSATDSLTVGGELYINTSSPLGRLHVAEPSLGNIPIFERTTTGTNTSYGAAKIQATSSNNMVDGFGPGLAFSIDDAGTTPTIIGVISGVRDGADNSGAIIFESVNAGANAETMRLTKEGRLGIGGVPSTAGTEILELDITGDIGAVNYCDENGDNCFVSTDVSAAGTPPGNDTEIIFNDSGAFGADALFTFNSATATMNIDGLMSLNDGSSNIFIEGGNTTLTGADNIIMGVGAGAALSTGTNNIAIGSAAMDSMTGGDNAVIIGYNAMSSSNANGVVAIGSEALKNGSGNNNTAVGTEAMERSSGTSTNNAAFGRGSLRHNVGGDSNTAIGFGAGLGVNGATLDANNNTFVGFYSAQGITTGDNNIFMGYQSGDATTTGASNIIIGYDIDTSAPAANEELNIGGIIFGDIGTTSLDPKIGAHQYCDENLANCFEATAVGTGIFEVVSNVVRGVSGTIDYATDDFVFGSAQLDEDIGTTDDNTRMFFDKGTGAFRAGTVTGTQWNNTNLGSNSAAFGSLNTASGQYSFVAGGTNSTVTGTGSVGLGSGVQATTNGAMAFGNQVTASATHAKAFGKDATASGVYSVVFGLGAPGNATRAAVSGANAFGIFMGDHPSVNMITANTMGVFGGNMMIDPAVPATELVPSAHEDTGTLAIDVEGYIGAIKYCDEDGNSCFDPVNVGASSVPGNDTEVVFNESGVYGTDTAFTFNSATNTLSVAGVMSLNDGSNNVFIGGGNTTGLDNVAIGDRAGENNTTNWNVYIGKDAGRNSTGGQSVIIGRTAGRNVGLATVVIGYNAGSLSTASSSVFIGASAGKDVDSGSNVMIGSGVASQNNVTGAGHTIIGINAGRNISGASIRNIFIGRSAGDATTTGSNNILIGDNLDTSAPAANEELNIGGVIFGDIGITSADPKIGAHQYCDENLANCFEATAVGTGVFEVISNVVLPNSAKITTTTDDFVFGSLQLLDTGTSADDNRFYFDKSAGAFRAGGAQLLEWDTVGDYSAAFGRNTAATGNYSMAWGDNSDATGTYSTAWGLSSAASGSYATAGGLLNVAGGTASIAMGRLNTADNTYSIALGLGNTSSGNASFAVGNTSIASGTTSIAMGQNTTASSANGVAIGNKVSATTGAQTMALGYEATATGARSLAIGVGEASTATYPVVSGAESVGIFMGDQNGVNISTSNVISILGGSMIINPDTTSASPAVPTVGVELDVVGDIQYTGTITDISDRRLKKDIVPLTKRGSMLERLARVDTYSFKMKNDEGGKTEFGVMAQELEPLFPELVQTAPDPMGTKSVNYTGLIAPMIEATKELKAENESLKTELSELKTAHIQTAQTLENLSDQVALLNKAAGNNVGKASMQSYIMLLLGLLGGMGLVLLITRRKNT